MTYNNYYSGSVQVAAPDQHELRDQEWPVGLQKPHLWKHLHNYIEAITGFIYTQSILPMEGGGGDTAGECFQALLKGCCCAYSVWAESRGGEWKDSVLITLSPFIERA